MTIPTRAGQVTRRAAAARLALALGPALVAQLALGSCGRIGFAELDAGATRERCGGSERCDFVCEDPRGCAYECGGSSTCTVSCRSDCPVSCSGSASCTLLCEAGTSSCTGNCELSCGM